MAIPTIQTILYATTIKPASKRVLRYALSISRQYNARVVILHVLEPVGEMGSALFKKYLPEEFLTKMQDEGIQSIKDTMLKKVSLFFEEEKNSLDEKFEQVIEPVVVEGRYADSILQQAEKQKADLIILGNETQAGMRRNRYITHHVIKNAKVPVIVVPAEKEKL